MNDCTNIQEYRKFFRKRSDSDTWITKDGEIVPIPRMSNEHLLLSGRMAERSGRTYFQKMLWEKNEQLRLLSAGKIVGIDEEQLKKDVERLTILCTNTIECARLQTPIYVRMRDEAVERGLLQLDETVEKAIDRWRIAQRKKGSRK